VTVSPPISSPTKPTNPDKERKNERKKEGKKEVAISHRSESTEEQDCANYPRQGGHLIKFKKMM